ncbi:MAG: hypothetical protein JNJ88_13105 [Planctomycetes bacterium]|nr:hypothetical protein [Planctomycetota bacterium]
MTMKAGLAIPGEGFQGVLARPVRNDASQPAYYSQDRTMSFESHDDFNGDADSPSTPSSNPPADSTAHRDQLLKKLNCLIAVLEAAISKVRRNQQSGHNDPDRLERIRLNLENTLTICQRAKTTLERRGALPANLPPEVSEAVGATSSAAPETTTRPARRRSDHQMTYRDYVELSSVEEFQKFRQMAPISVEEIAACDLDSLASELSKNG